MAFEAILTTIGQNKIADAIANSGTVTITEGAVGDGGGAATTPDVSDTALVNEVGIRYALNDIEAVGNQITMEIVIPPTDGGYTIRELGFFDDVGDLIVIASVPENYKPGAGEGSLKESIYKATVSVQDAAVVDLTIDPSLVTATKEWVREFGKDHLQTVDTLAELQALGAVTDGKARLMTERTSGNGGGGEFIPRVGDYSAQVAADEVTPGEGDGGIWVAFGNDKTGASGAWERQYGQTPMTVDIVKSAWYGLLQGNSDVNNDSVFSAMFQSGRVVQMPEDKVFLVSQSQFNDIQNLTVEANGSEIRSTVPQPTAAHEATIWWFEGSVFGESSNIKIHNLIVDYVTAPTSRIDNNFALFARYTDGFDLIGCEVKSSWSAGVWTVFCSNILFDSNTIGAVYADGITCQAPGRNVTYRRNSFSNTQDDSIAVTWFTGDVGASVGETGAQRTKNVTIEYNTISGSKARGIYLGGVEGGAVKGNYIKDSDAYSILLNRDTYNPTSVFYDVSGVGNSNKDVDVKNNYIYAAALNSNSPSAEVGGIFIGEYNISIDVDKNKLYTPNNVGILCSGNANITRNTIISPTLLAGGSVAIGDMPYKGSHIVTADFNATDSCYGTISGNRLIGGEGRAVWVRAGYNSRGWSVKDNRAFDVGDSSNVSDSLTINAPYYADTIAYSLFDGNAAHDSRTTSIPYAFYQDDSTGGIEFGPSNVAYSSNGFSSGLLRHASGGSTRTYREVTIDPPSIPAGGTNEINVALGSADVGDFVMVSPPYDLQGIVSQPFVNVSGNVKLSLYNPTGAAIDLPAGLWRARVIKNSVGA